MSSSNSLSQSLIISGSSALFIGHFLITSNFVPTIAKCAVSPVFDVD